jgi:DNA-binding NtrC family response regulator
MTKKILVADDSHHIRTMLHKELTAMGWEVTLADNGEQALRLWKYDSYDALSTDIDMPWVNGLRLARDVRKHSPGARIFIFTTTDDARGLFMEDMGGAGYFLKKDPLAYIDALEKELKS